jgi:hypothetical protein
MIGHKSGCLNSKPRVTFIGFQSGIKNQGDYSTFIGYQSGKENITSESNTFIGYNTGASVSSCGDNVFIGSFAGESSYDSCGSVFIGNKSGRTTQGSYNTYIGEGSGSCNCNSSYNIFIGNKTGEGFSDGNNSIFIGNCTGCSNTGSVGNYFIGHGVGTSNKGQHNIFIGKGVGPTNEGDYNILIGYESGISSATASFIYNTFIGRNTGYSNISGGYNVFIGDASGACGVTQSKSVFVGNESGRYLEYGTNNTFVGYQSGTQLITGYNNVFIGDFSGSIGTVSNSIALGSCAVPQLDGEFALGSSTYPVLIGTSSVAPNSDNLFIRINDDSYKIPLYDKNGTQSVDDVLGYKTYVAVLRQYAPLTGATSSQSLIDVGYDGFYIGQLWTVSTYSTGDDFSNMELISGTMNESGSVIKATSGTPSVWTEGSVLDYGGEPFVISIDRNGNICPLENTLGNIVWQYEDVGIFNAYLPNSFPIEKTVLLISQTNPGYPIAFYWESIDNIKLETYNFASPDPPEAWDGSLGNQPSSIKIIVYN